MQRSDALNEWIAKHSTSEGLIEDLPNLSPSLKKELLREALELNIDIRQNYENRDGSVKAIRDQIALVAYCKTKEVFGNVSLDIPLLNFTNTLSFNILDNSSLFGVFIPNIQERRYFRNEVLAARMLPLNTQAKPCISSIGTSFICSSPWRRVTSARLIPRLQAKSCIV